MTVSTILAAILSCAFMAAGPWRPGQDRAGPEAGKTLTATRPAAAESPAPAGMALLRTEARKLSPLVRERLAKDFLAAVDRLPPFQPRTIYQDPASRMYLSGEAAARLGSEERGRLIETRVDEQLYYYTRFGSPLVYVRLLELLGARGLDSVDGKRVLDFGYGSIGQLQLLALLGADAVGTEVHPLLAALYTHPSDQGPVPPGGRAAGRISLFDGRWPADPRLAPRVGRNFDVITSKNTLKNGYLNPEKPVDKRMLVDLGVEHAEFVRALKDALKPGGYMLIYNICPAPAREGEPYIPWADGRCPFPLRTWEEAGFEVIAFDVQDDAAARAIFQALGYPTEKGTPLEPDIFAWYTLVRRPG